MPFDNLLVQRESRIAVLTVLRPTRLNALDASTLGELRQAALGPFNMTKIAFLERRPARSLASAW